MVENLDSPPAPVFPEVPAKPAKRKKRTPEEIEADRLAKEAAKEQRKIEQAAARVRKAQEREQAKIDAKLKKIADAQGGLVELPAAVFRSGRVVHVSLKDAWAVLEGYLKHLFLDVEHSGYPIGHKLYELRTVQLGGEECAIVFDAADAKQMEVASLALSMAEKITSHSSAADNIPLVHAGYISWDEIWSKTHNSVLYLKLIDPKLSGSEANALKEAAADLLGKYAISPQAEKDKNALFRAMGCLTETSITTPPDKNGWNMVDKRAYVMLVYAGSDVLDLAAIMRVLPELPVDNSVLERERWFDAKCSRIGLDGFPLDEAHIKEKIAEYEKSKIDSQQKVFILSYGRISNPSSPEVVSVLKEQYPEIDFTIKDKKTKEFKDSAAKAVLERVAAQAKDADPGLFHLCKQIIEYRHCVTTLGLLLRPLENLCEHGDGRMRPTVYTINADTGRTSCVRPNGQQFSRQGGIRACVCAECGYVMCNADLQGCEIRVGAALSGDWGLYEAEVSPMCYYCNENPCGCGNKHTGLHWKTAHTAYGQNATYENRYNAKRGTFTKLFGGGVEMAAQQVYCDVKDMQRLFEAFNSIAPVYVAWDDWLRKCFYEGKMVWRDYEKGENFAQDIEGRKRGIYRTYSGRNIYVNAPHAFSNYAIQGTARELLLDGVIRWSYGPWGHLPILPIHDEMLLWVKEADFEPATAYLQQSMESTILSSPGHVVHIGADPELKRYHYWPDSS